MWKGLEVLTDEGGGALGQAEQVRSETNQWPEGMADDLNGWFAVVSVPKTRFGRIGDAVH
jgi:hypothetical protein